VGQLLLQEGRRLLMAGEIVFFHESDNHFHSLHDVFTSSLVEYRVDVQALPSTSTCVHSPTGLIAHTIEIVHPYLNVSALPTIQISH
jgi:hypothetical protein